jgi:hypothetical protein
MKKILAIVTILCTLTKVDAQIYTIPWAQQQPRWVFPLWFEDAAGKKDTLYFAWDENADLNSLDTVFGEMPISADSLDHPYDSTNFKTWVLTFKNNPAIPDLEDYVTPSKCFIVEYYDNFPMSNIIGASIHAYNFTYQVPITIKWDKNLFNSLSLITPVKQAYFESEYFFHTQGSNGKFNLMEADSVVLPQYNSVQGHFPIYLTIETLDPLGIKEEKTDLLSLYPNPATDYIKIRSKLPSKITVKNIFGESVIIKNNFTINDFIDVSGLSRGMYLVEIGHYNDSKIKYEKIILR